MLSPFRSVPEIQILASCKQVLLLTDFKLTFGEHSFTKFTGLRATCGFQFSLSTMEISWAQNSGHQVWQHGAIALALSSAPLFLYIKKKKVCVGETISQLVALASLEVAMQTRLAMNTQRSASASQILRVKVCAAMPASIFSSKLLATEFILKGKVASFLAVSLAFNG